jgi:hypothetical protein
MFDRLWARAETVRYAFNIINYTGFLKEKDALEFCLINPNEGCCALLRPQTQTKNSQTSQSYLAIGLAVAGLSILLVAMIVYFTKYRGRKREGTEFSEDSKTSAFKVVQRYTPQLIDEIQLNIGDVVIVKERFDDGWGAGLNITTESEGSFPLNCLSNLKPVDGSKLEMGTLCSTRNSSLSQNSTEKYNDDDLLFASVKIAPTEEGEKNGHNHQAVEQNEDEAPEPWIENIYSAFKGRQKDSGKAPETEVKDKSSTIKFRDDDSAQGNFDDIYSTVKIRDNNSAKVKERNFDDIYSTVKIKNQESNLGTVRLPPKSKYDFEKSSSVYSNANGFESIYCTVKAAPRAAPSAAKPERALGSKLSPIITENLTKTPVRVGKSPRKFSNDDLKYGTFKSSSAHSPKLSPARPTFTSTFNQKP